MQRLEYDPGRVGAYLGLGAGFAGVTLLFAALGQLLDRHIGTTPIFTLLGVFIGGAAGSYHLYRRAMELQGDGAKDQPTNGSSEPSREAPDE